MATCNIEFAFVLQALWERKEVKRRNGVKIECAARVVGHTRDYVRRMGQKSCLPFEEINVEITMILCFWLFRGEACGLQKMWPRGEIRARCRGWIRHRNRQSQFWG